eukprot:UC4_evm1s1372
MPRIAERSRMGYRKVKFYRNGDKFDPGRIMIVNKKNFGSWDSLLEELSFRVLAGRGVRRVYSLEGCEVISELRQLQDGGEYVCVGTENRLVRIAYRKNRAPAWKITDKKPIRDSNLALSPRKRKRLAPRTGAPFTYHVPKIKKIVVYKNDSFERDKKVTVILTKRSAQSLGQVLSQLSSMRVFPDGVRKLYTVDGELVTDVQTLKAPGTSEFVAVGREPFKHINRKNLRPPPKFFCGGRAPLPHIGENIYNVHSAVNDPCLSEGAFRPNAHLRPNAVSSPRKRSTVPFNFEGTASKPLPPIGHNIDDIDEPDLDIDFGENKDNDSIVGDAITGEKTPINDAEYTDELLAETNKDEVAHIENHEEDKLE